MNFQDDVLRVLFLASEAAPLIKVGGLGDVAGSLPQTLQSLGPPDWLGPRIEVRLVLPFHTVIHKQIVDPQLIATFDVSRKSGSDQARVYLTNINGLSVYLIDGAPIIPDDLVYSRDPDLDGRKYVFFSLAAVQMIEHLDWKPDVLHANDWHTGAALYSLALRSKDARELSSIRKIISVHNLPFMGKDAVQAMRDFGIPPVRQPPLPEWAELFPLPLGMLSADQIVAVSPGYADEILTPEFGCGLQDFLLTRKEHIDGILNGLDQETWDPSHDGFLQFPYSAQTLDQKGLNKAAMQVELNLEEKPEIPLLVMVSRMDQQKGVDIAIQGLRLTADHPWQAVILGTGDSVLETGCRSLEAEFPDRVRALIKFDNALSHRLYAAGDILLMPSRYEPCGLSQMISMRYGTVPFARATGGLRDTILDDPTMATSTGFLFKDPQPDAFSEGLRRTLYSYDDRSEWKKLQARGMSQDFSWRNSALKYAHLYIA